MTLIAKLKERGLSHAKAIEIEQLVTDDVCDEMIQQMIRVLPEATDKVITDVRDVRDGKITDTREINRIFDASIFLMFAQQKALSK